MLINVLGEEGLLRDHHFFATIGGDDHPSSDRVDARKIVRCSSLPSWGYAQTNTGIHGKAWNGITTGVLLGGKV